MVLGSVLGLSAVGVSFALPSPLQVKPGKISPFVQSGVVVGGQSGAEFSLLDLQVESLRRTGERIVLTYGDRYGNSLKNEPGFYQVSLDRNARRLVIDLAQINKTTLDPMKLTRIMTASQLVSASEISMDPSDGSTNITFVLKEPVRLKITTEDSRSARILIDLERVAQLNGKKP
jgi:hypothetical protein